MGLFFKIAAAFTPPLPLRGRDTPDETDRQRVGIDVTLAVNFHPENLQILTVIGQHRRI
jgi:hypothetical protein